MKHATPNAADRVAELFTTHAVDLLRFDAAERQRIRRLLQQVERDIVAQLHRDDPTTIRRPTFRERRLIALADQVRTIIRSGYRTIANTHARELAELAEIEEGFTRAAINRAVGVEVMTVGVSEAALREIARGTLVGDLDKRAVTRDWWAGQSDRLARDFTRVVRVGLAQGESIGDLVRRVRGTTRIVGGERVVEGGIMQASRRDAAALVRTAVSAVSNATRSAVYRANDDVVKGEQHVSTLDGRTTLICISLDGAAWDFEGNPLPQSPYRRPSPGPLPLHWGERSTRIAVLRSLAEIMDAAGERKAARVGALPQATRASMDGQIAAKVTWAEFLAQKESAGPAFANRMLGRTRANLWRAGKLDVAELIDQSGNPLTLDGLRRNVRAVTGRAIEEARAA